MRLFKKRFPAKSLAVLLMQYTITGDTITDDGGLFALGPHGISVTDGSNVLPENVERTNKNQLSSRDSLIIALETMYLRGFVVSILLNSFIKNNRVRESVLSSYSDFWRGWSNKDSLDYQDFFERARQVYGARILISDLEKKSQNSNGDDDSQDVSRMVKEIGSEFSSLCDPFNVIRDPLRSELAKMGEATFVNASQVVANVLETVLEKHRVTVK